MRRVPLAAASQVLTLAALAALLAGAADIADAAAPPAARTVPAASSAPSAPSNHRGAADLPELGAPDLNLRAMLLLLEDRRAYEPVTVLTALKGGPELRAELAAALGRAQDAAGRSVLEGLLIDAVPEVRRAAAFALGLLGDREARPALLQAVHDPDRETGGLAVEALGRLGTPVLEVGEQLLGLPEAERWPRLLPYLFRFKDEAVVQLAEHGLGLADPGLHAQAAYALAREPQPAALPLLRRLLGDPDPQVRAWAARGLGRAGNAADLAALAPLLGDGAAGPATEALRAGVALAARLPGATREEASLAAGAPGAAAPPPAARAPVGGTAAATAAGTADWRPRLLPLLADPRAGVRVSAIEAAGYWLPDAGLAAALAARAGAAGSPVVERGLALVALARGESTEHPPAGSASGSALPGGAVPSGARPAAPSAAAVSATLSPLLAAAAGAPETRLRAYAAEAAGLAGAGGLLSRLATDRSPLVREAALAAVLAAGSAGGAARVAEAGLADRDEGVRITALTWLADHPVVPLAALRTALIAALRDESIESPLGAIRAVTARAEAEPRERGALVELLEGAARQPSHVLRREATLALVRLGRPALPPGPAAGGRAGDLADNLDLYRGIVERTRRPRTVEVRTSRGSFRLRLDCAPAPRTCLNFLELAGQHFYDGLTFHRVVPGFVVQAGDPRGDGFGGPGYTLRDEINRLRYRRGVVGMALAGADTGGSQFFVTLSPQPHLDGGYTAFGEVVSGAEVLDAIEAGDRIDRIAEVR